VGSGARVGFDVGVDVAGNQIMVALAEGVTVLVAVSRIGSSVETEQADKYTNPAVNITAVRII
jgi:hypothetical protein